jgi:hypothetical protein
MGNYAEITPSHENVNYFVQQFLGKGFIPSLYSEYKLELGENPVLIPKMIPNPRLRLSKGDNSWNINLLSSKIDFILANIDISVFDMPDFDTFITDCKEFIKIIGNKYPNRHQRLGIIRNFLLSGQDEKIQRKFVKNPPVFDNKLLQQWTYNTVSKEQMSNDVELKVVSAIQKIKTPITKNSQKVDFEGIQFSFDVNTIDDNDFRFDSMNINNSIDKLVSILSNTINETFKYIESDE